MNNIICTIEIPKNLEMSLEIKNDITKFLDRYNILLPHIDSQYYEMMETYIDIDKIDVRQAIEDGGFSFLSFRIPGATRGSIKLEKVHVHKEFTKYKIVSIDFIESTCFETLKAYRRGVVEASNTEFCGKEIIINFYDK